MNSQTMTGLASSDAAEQATLCPTGENAPTTQDNLAANYLAFIEPQPGYTP